MSDSIRSDIQRWRTIATNWKEHDGREKISFVTKKRDKKSITSKVESKLTVPFPLNYETHDPPPKMRSYLDQLGKAQRKDIAIMSTGYLNHDLVNRNFDSANGVDPLSKITTDNAAPPDDIDNSRTIQEVLEEYDPIKAKESRTQILSEKLSTLTKPRVVPTNQNESNLVIREFFPGYQTNVTKNDQYNSLKIINEKVVDGSWMYKKGIFSKADKLKELYEYIDMELEALGCPRNGPPDLRRLQVFSSCFDRVISEFKTYGPILAEIKCEYDKVISTYQYDEKERNFLRAKVQKLLSQNENRLLLKYERKKSNHLEVEIQSLQDENSHLKLELKRKLALYSKYLPPSVLAEKKKEAEELPPLEKDMDPLESDDPITLYEKKIEKLQMEVEAKTAEVNGLKTSLDNEYVSKEAADKLAESYNEIEAILNKIKERTQLLEQELASKQIQLTSTEASLQEKEDQYLFLITEYNELSEKLMAQNQNAA